MPPLSAEQLTAKYMGVLAHVHTRLSNFPIHIESNLTVGWLVRTLQAAGLAGSAGAPLNYVLLTEHVSNPARPKSLGHYSPRLKSLVKQSRPGDERGVTLLYGYEVSMLPTGGIDLPRELLDSRPVVIASRHRLPTASEKDPDSIMRLFAQACSNPHIRVLGHPTRNIEDVQGVDWARVFDEAAKSGTAIEINFNIFPDPEKELARFAYWQDWLHKLGKSKAQVFMGNDLHTRKQVKRLIAGWAKSRARPGRGDIVTCLQSVSAAGISSGRVVTANPLKLQRWAAIDKSAAVAVSSG